MSKNRFFSLIILSALTISSCGTVSNPVVKPAEIIRGTTNNETLNGYRSFELGEAILLFMPDKNMEPVGWDFRSDAPILWLTKGYEIEKENLINKKAESFRKGLMRINVQGTTSTILRQKKEEFAWTVHYSTFNLPKFGVESVELFVGDSNNVCESYYDNCTFKPEKSMNDAGINVRKICDQHFNEGNGFTGFELNYPDKRKVFGQLRESAGSGAASATFKLFYSLKNEKKLCEEEDISDTRTETNPTENTLSLKKTSLNKFETDLISKAEKDNLKAQKELSLYYRSGLFGTTDTDIEKGFYWAKKAAEQGDAESECDFSFYFANEEKYKNRNEAFYWIKKSVEGKWGDFKNDKNVRNRLAMCQFSLALDYENGGGTPKDISKAIYWYKKSADLGFDEAKEKLAILKNETKKNSEKSAPKIVSEIMGRCRKDMGQYGAAIVKGCVDQDVKAAADIVHLLKTYPVVSQRCLNDMGQYGYAIVKGCITQDIDAEEALKRY